MKRLFALIVIAFALLAGFGNIARADFKPSNKRLLLRDISNQCNQDLKHLGFNKIKCVQFAHCSVGLLEEAYRNLNEFTTDFKKSPKLVSGGTYMIGRICGRRVINQGNRI